MVGSITREGAFLEVLDRNPARLLPPLDRWADLSPRRITLTGDMGKTLAQLKGVCPGELVLFSGTLIIARDIAHARLLKTLKETGKLPDAFTSHPIYYAGPANPPPGMPLGSLGPTTAQRMDDYVPPFMAHGASLVMLAKGNRAPKVAKACATFGGYYLGTVGGAAALLSKEHLLSSTTIAFHDLGMEAVRQIEVHDLPAFVVTNAQGESLYCPPKRSPLFGGE